MFLFNLSESFLEKPIKFTILWGKIILVKISIWSNIVLTERKFIAVCIVLFNNFVFVKYSTILCVCKISLCEYHYVKAKYIYELICKCNAAEY